MTPKERQEWLAERRKGIGGSDVAAILGMSPWATPLTVWLDKTGRAPDKPETEAMRIGTELEDFVARRYAQETGRVVQRFNKMLHKGCFLGNLDRLVVPEGQKVASHMGEIRTDTLLECKTTSVDWTDGVPLYYVTQVQHYMGLDERLKHADVAALFLTHKRFETYRVVRDDEVIKAMQTRLAAWWDEYVVGGKMPPPSCEEDNKIIYAISSPGKKIVANDDIKRKLEQFKEAKAAEKAAKEQGEKLKTEICAFMKDAEALMDDEDNILATWKNNRDKCKTDWEGLALALNASTEQVAAYTITSPGDRPFKPKATKAA